MLRLLLDEHLSPRITHQFRVKWPEAQIESVLQWEGGWLSGIPDPVLLAEAHKHGGTLVTYDQATITPLLKVWAEQGIQHSGVILVDDRTITQNDIGALIRALGAVWNQEKGSDWKNAVMHLTRL
jgi:hypothetical protein